MRNSANVKNDLYILILMAFSLPIISELKFYPFHDTFRISFSSAVFLFFLLWVKKIPLVLYGIVIGASTVIFRITIDFIFKSGFQFYSDFLLHFPAFFYYLVFSYLLYITKVNSFHNNPILIGILATFTDISSSIVELLIRFLVLKNPISIFTLGLICIISTVRSFFVLGFFNIVELNQVKDFARRKEEKNRYMLLLISNLYAESLQLKNSLSYAENITKNCYNLYESLQHNHLSKFDPKKLSQKLLEIAGQVHEIKKDNQRIYAGLSKMISSEDSKDYMDISEIADIIVETNKKYSLSLGKQIEFFKDISSNIPELHSYTVMSIINNLVSNSVEAIEKTGIIKISIYRKYDSMVFKIKDNGTGIPEKKRELIFKPGYTTKYNEFGEPSTGIGLSYVKNTVANLNGRVLLNSEGNCSETIFTIEIPLKSLMKKEVRK
ncbi:MULTISPECIES: sensor histidine kinase [Clostridium]|uniref:histidine kinase n=1 Tax=Clostridium lapidicellarium TaxID=3240931 RepID=A0ABV4DVR3_9CLOT|nr:sensor histidine kinase [uncultured Clostridium sp.]